MVAERWGEGETEREREREWALRPGCLGERGGFSASLSFWLCSES